MDRCFEMNKPWFWNILTKLLDNKPNVWSSNSWINNSSNNPLTLGLISNSGEFVHSSLRERSWGVF